MSRANLAVDIRTKVVAALVAIMVALVGMAAAQPAYASDSDTSYYMTLSGVPYNGDYGIYAKPGEKLTLKAQVRSGDQWGSNKAVSGATYKWTFNKKVKATTSGAKATIKKLPGTGKYKFRITASDAAGNELLAQTYTIVVKKKPGVKIDVRAMTSKGQKAATSLKKGQDFMIEMKNASFGWDNNTKKAFYTWTVKKGGKTATWNTKSGSFKKNSLVGAGTVYGGYCPIMMGSFKQTGTYKIIATVYHSNKKIQTVTKTIKVK